MKAFARIPLVLAAALFGAQQAIACCCLDDLVAHAQEPAAELPSCHDHPDEGQADKRNGCPSDCSDCGDIEPAPPAGPAKAIASKGQPWIKLPPALADHSVVPVRQQSVRIIGPPPAVPRSAQTPVQLKQRLLT